MALPLSNYANFAANTKFVLSAIPRFDAGKMFKISVAQGQTLTINNCDSWAANSELKVYNNDGTVVSQSMTGWNNTLALDITLTGDYYIHVRGNDAYSGLEHSTLTVKLNTTGEMPLTPLLLPAEPSATNSTSVGTGFTQAQLDSAVSTAVSGLHNQAYTDSAVSAAVSGLFTQSQLDSAVLNSKVGLFTQTQLDSAVSLALSAVPSVPASDISSLLANLTDVDISSASHSVTFSKLKTDYTAFDTDKKVVGNALANKIVTSSNATNVSAGDGNDTVNGGAGNDTIDGGKGDDVIESSGANSKLSGGDNNDSISLMAIAGDVVSSVDTLDGGAGNDLLMVVGFSGKHKLIGGAGNDVLVHSDLNGSATLDGGAGSDIFYSRNSLDVLTGGADADFFNIPGANGSIKITDFKSTVDKLVFTDSATTTALDSSHFVTSITNSFVFTAADSYGFNSKTGALFYDVDGAGGDDAVQVALLGKVPLIASDILIF